jgi:hypothetical protein
MAPAGRRRAGKGRGVLAALLGLFLDLKREIAVAALLAVAAGIAFGIYRSMRVEPELPRLEGALVPLTEEQVQAWAQASAVLAERRTAGTLAIPARSLPDFLEWARDKRELLAEVAPDLDPETYAGLTRSLERARTWERKFWEYETLAAAQEEAFKRMENSGAEFRAAPPPTLTEEEWADLRAYEAQVGLVEYTLLALMPSLPPLIIVPEAEPESVEGEEKALVPAKSVKWRVVNTSRYGPKVIRTQ